MIALISVAGVLLLSARTHGFSPSVEVGVGRSQPPGKTQTALHMATWSDSRAVKDYQEFLSSGKQEIERLPDGPSLIIQQKDGDASMAEALKTMGMGDDMIVTPDDALPESVGGQSEFPIYVTLPPYELEDFIRNLSDAYKAKAEDFVFLSGGPKYGNIEDVLKKFGYCRDSMTQVVISGMEIKPLGVEDISCNIGVDGNGEDKLANVCTACGKWNGAVAERFEKSQIKCDLDFYREWRRKMWERNVYDAVFNLIGAVRSEPTTLGDVANYYHAEVADMVWEISSNLRGWKAITLLYGFEDRMYGTGETSGKDEICHLDDKMFDFMYNSRVFTESKTLNSYLFYANEELGLLKDVTLPRKMDGSEEKRQIMRKGILRADGKI